MIVLVMLISCAASVVKVIAKQSRAYASHRAEVNLKRELVDRGLSVDEIERLIVARSSTGSETRCG
jgi:cell division protein FtsL